MSEEQWSAPTLCTGWMVRHVAAHLLQHAFVALAGRSAVLADLSGPGTSLLRERLRA